MDFSRFALTPAHPIWREIDTGFPIEFHGHIFTYGYWGLIVFDVDRKATFRGKISSVGSNKNNGSRSNREERA